MKSPLDSPEGNWWNEKVNRRESMWLGLSGAWAVTLFGWMLGWLEFGDQNPVGETLRVSTEDYQSKVNSYKEATGEVDGVRVPADEHVYVGAARYAFDGLPVVLEAGREYVFHLGTYDVQHGFSVRKEDTLSKQMSLQMLPGYEWKVPMTFDETGTYHVVCNEFCGTGHRTMHASFEVRERVPEVSGGSGDDGGSGDSAAYGGWLDNVDNYDGEAVDRTGQDRVTIEVGTEGNSGAYAFAPAAVRVDPGTTVTWEWTGNGGQHNVVADSGDFESELVAEGGHTFEQTIEETTRYYCSPHRSLGMKGVVEVA